MVYGQGRKEKGKEVVGSRSKRCRVDLGGVRLRNRDEYEKTHCNVFDILKELIKYIRKWKNRFHSDI